MALYNFTAGKPVSFARYRQGDIYAVTGYGRGMRWDAITAAAEQLGITAPTTAPTVSTTVGTPSYYVDSVQVTDNGCGYSKPPVLTITGATSVAAKALVRNSGLGRAVVLDRGLSTTSAVTIAAAAPDLSQVGSGGTLTVTVAGRVLSASLTNFGSGYTTTPTVACTGGSPDAVIYAVVTGSSNQVTHLRVASQGVYTSDPSITFSGGGGSGAAATPLMRYKVATLAVSAAGTDYSPQATVEFQGAEGAFADLTVTNTGALSAVKLLSGGFGPTNAITATVVQPPSTRPRRAMVTANVLPAICGKYWCATRYVDNTSPSPIPSNLSPIASVSTAVAVASIAWSGLSGGAEARADKLELWRTTSDQALVMYRVTSIAVNVSTYTDTMSDADLSNPERVGFAVLPLTLANGALNAMRFTPPPQNKAVVAMFQDRAWYGVDVPGRTYAGGVDASASEPNTLYFSEADEPESVPEINQLIVQQNLVGYDAITALMPTGGSMIIFQRRHAYRLSFVSQPIIDANIVLLGERGCFNSTCWDSLNGVSYVVDAAGMYSIDGGSIASVSEAVDDLWTDAVIGFSFANSKFFYVKADPLTQVVRFFYAITDQLPDRSLCYHPGTKAWWSETYAQTFSSAAAVTTGGQMTLALGGQAGDFYRADYGVTDKTSANASADIACVFKSGNFPLVDEKGGRAIQVLYRPTSGNCDLTLALRYNGSATARPSAITEDTGSGFTTTAGGGAVLNLSSARSTLGDATGVAKCQYSGRQDTRSAGSDRHIAIDLSLTRPATGSVILYGLAVEGVSG